MARSLTFNIFAWYWVCGDTNPTTQVFSSAVGGMIANTDAGYVSWVGADGSGSQAISGAADNGGGKVRLTVENTANMATAQVWVVTAVGGTTEANGTVAITVVDSTHVDLLTVNFVHAYTSGGFIGCGTRVPTEAEVQRSIDQFNVDFFNSTAQPYQSVTLTAGVGSLTTLSLPYARVYLITTTAAGQRLRLPAANVPGSMPLGVPILIISSGPNNFTIENNVGTGLVNLGTVGAYYLIKNSSTTAAGLWISQYLSAENQPTASGQIPISQGAPDNVGTSYLTITGDLTLTSAGVMTIANGVVSNAKLANSAMTFATTSTGLSVPGSVSLGGTVTIGNVTDNVNFNSYNVASAGTSISYKINSVSTMTWTPSGHYVTFNSPNNTQAWQSGDGTDQANYFSQSEHYFYDKTIASLVAQFRAHSSGASPLAVFFPGASTTASAANAFLDTGTTPTQELKRSTSSGKFKTNIKTLLPQDAKDKIGKLRPLTYQSSIVTDDPTLTHLGLVAEEVALVDPRLVHFGYDPTDFEAVPIFDTYFVENDDGSKTQRSDLHHIEQRLKAGAVKSPQSVQYERLTVLLLQYIQELEARVQQLEGKKANPPP